MVHRQARLSFVRATLLHVDSKCGIGEEIVGEFAPSLKQRGCIDLRRLVLPLVAVTDDGILEKGP